MQAARLAGLTWCGIGHRQQAKLPYVVADSEMLAGADRTTWTDRYCLLVWKAERERFTRQQCE